MNEIEVFDCKGKKIESIEIIENINKEKIDRKIVDKIISLANFQYTKNLKQNTKKVKNRSEVKASTRKIIRQKGTGSARHGSVAAPQFRGGGIAFGPRGEKGKRLKINKKFKKHALGYLLDVKNNSKEITVIDEIVMNNWKTKEAYSIILPIISKMIEKKNEDGIEIKKKQLLKKKILMIVSKEDNNLEKIKIAFRNIDNLGILESNVINPYYLISNRWIITTKKAFMEINKRIM